jgi:hypothetical protein
MCRRVTEPAVGAVAAPVAMPVGPATHWDIEDVNWSIDVVNAFR